MKSKIAFLLTIMVVFAVFVAGTNLKANGKKIKETYTGTTQHKGVDPNDDGYGVIFGICAGDGTLGPFTCNSWSELDPLSVQPNPLCPKGYQVGFRTFAHVERYENGDLLYQRLNPEEENYVCPPSEEGVWSGSAVTHYVGGTGRFEGATGYTVWEFGGHTLEPSPGGGALFSGTFGTITGKLFLAKPEADDGQ